MEVLQWLVDATSVSGLVIYCAGVAVVMGVLVGPVISIIDGKSAGSPSRAIMLSHSSQVLLSVSSRVKRAMRSHSAEFSRYSLSLFMRSLLAQVLAALSAPLTRLLVSCSLLK